MARPTVRGIDLCRCCRLIASKNGKHRICSQCMRTVCVNCVAKDRAVTYQDRLFCTTECAEDWEIDRTQTLLETPQVTPFVGTRTGRMTVHHTALQNIQVDFSRLKERMLRAHSSSARFVESLRRSQQLMIHDSIVVDIVDFLAWPDDS